MAGSRRWVVTTDGQRDLAEVAEDLAARGLTAQQVHDQFGVIVGEASEDAPDRLRAVPGVAEVEPETPPPSVGPPDAPETW